MGALLGAGKRLLTGESLFMTVFTNQGSGKQQVAFAAPYPGKILAMDLKQLGGQLICQKDSFLCAARGVSIGIAFQRKIGVGPLRRRRLHHAAARGRRPDASSTPAARCIRSISARDRRCAWTPDVSSRCSRRSSYDIQFVGKIKTALFGGEGLFFAALTGPGTGVAAVAAAQPHGRSHLQGRSGGRRQAQWEKVRSSAGSGDILDGDNSSARLLALGSRLTALGRPRSREPQSPERQSPEPYNELRMRKPVTLVTGANGEIGHGLVTGLPAAGRPVVTIDIAGLEPGLVPLVLRSRSPARSPTRALLERVLAEFEVDLIFHLAALLSTRAEFTPLTAHQVNVDGTLNLLEFAQREGESHGRPVIFVYPSSIAAYGLPDLETKAQRGACSRGRVEHAAHDVRLQQAVLRAPGPLLRALLQAAGGPRGRSRGLPLRPVSRPHLGHHRARGRHLRLRARDDPRGGPATSPMPVSSGPTPAFRSWRCPTPSMRCWRWRRRRLSA